jgi:hypothetical protein
MKNKFIILPLLLISTGLQSMKLTDKLTDNDQYILISNANTLENKITEYVDKCLENQNWNINQILKNSQWAINSENAAKKAIKIYRDENGNTITHLLVNHKKADDLYTCLNKGLLSLEKNNEGQTPLEIALTNFCTYFESEEFQDTTHLSNIDRKDAKCCYYILINYIKSKQTWYEWWIYNYKPQKCCDIHVF